MHILDLFKTSKSLNWVKDRALKDIHLILKKTDTSKIAILSIDMQPKYLKRIYPKQKIQILLLYHVTIKQLCIKYEIDFLEIEYSDSGDNFLKDSDSLVFTKKADSATSSDALLNHLKSNLKTTLYIIGINRTACVFSSIIEFRKKGYSIITSFLGTGTTKEMGFDDYNQRMNVENYTEYYKDIYKNQNLENCTLRNDLAILLKNGVVILDYYDKERMKAA